MKWRSTSSFAFIIFLCGVFAVANSSPAAKKEAFEPEKGKLEDKISPSISDDQAAGEEDDDLLARAKKSSLVTTFCVKIEPGNDQPAVVVCQPENSDQVPPPGPLQPPVQEEISNYQIPEMIPEYTRGMEPQPPIPYEPLIFIPQQPQILQPQIYAPYIPPPQILQPYPQPQIVLLRDPSCPSNPANAPTAYVNPLPKNLYSNAFFSSQLFGKSSQYEPKSGNIWQGGYEPEEEELRSIPVGSNFGGMLNNQGYTSLSDLMYQKRGQAQQNPLTNTVTLAQGPAGINRGQNLRGQYENTYTIQCKPSVVPLSQNGFADSSGKSNDQAALNPAMKSFGVTGLPSPQYMQQYSSGQGPHGVYTTHGAMHHQKELSMHNGHHQFHSNVYPHNKPYTNMHYRTMSGSGGPERAAGEAGDAVKTGEQMSMQNHGVLNSFAKNGGNQQLGEQMQYDSQATFKDQGGHQAVLGADAKAPMNQDQQQQKILPGDKLMDGSQNFESRFYPNSFGQGQNNFANGGAIQTPNGKDQGFKKQIGFSSQNQPQQQQQQTIPGTPRNSGMEENNHPQQTTGKYSQMLLQRMKSSLAQGNMVQPFMASGEKQMQLKA